MSLAAVRDLREVRDGAGPEELVDFETDVLAGFVLARVRGRALRRNDQLRVAPACIPER